MTRRTKTKWRRYGGPCFFLVATLLFAAGASRLSLGVAERRCRRRYTACGAACHRKKCPMAALFSKPCAHAKPES